MFSCEFWGYFGSYSFYLGCDGVLQSMNSIDAISGIIKKKPQCFTKPGRDNSLENFFTLFPLVISALAFLFIYTEWRHCFARIQRCHNTPLFSQ